MAWPLNIGRSFYKQERNDWPEILNVVITVSIFF